MSGMYNQLYLLTLIKRDLRIFSSLNNIHIYNYNVKE